MRQHWIVLVALTSCKGSTGSPAATPDAAPPLGDASIDAATCGDGTCSADEDCSVCAADCGACPDWRNVTFTLGAEETAFHHATDACNIGDLPDVPAHALHTASGILLIAGNATINYGSVGADFYSLVRRCASPLLVSDASADVTTFSNYSWLASVYDDGLGIYGLVHNEFHDPDPNSPNCAHGDLSPGNPCTYTSVTMWSSREDAAHFTHTAVPTQLVAPPPYRWDSGTGAPPWEGVMEPSNIVRGRDGYYYAMVRRIDGDGDGTCVMRTTTLDQPSSWRFWTGTDWSGAFVDPYSVPPGSPLPACQRVSNATIHALRGSLTYNSYLGQYLLVGYESFMQGGQLVCGFYASASQDLIRWGAPKLIKQAPATWPQCAQSGPIQFEAYPSIIDHADTTTNFERSGKTPYVYFTRSFGTGIDRDLIRIPLTLQ
jgi:hypothetical protein